MFNRLFMGLYFCLSLKERKKHFVLTTISGQFAEFKGDIVFNPEKLDIEFQFFQPQPHPLDKKNISGFQTNFIIHRRPPGKWEMTVV